MQRLVISHMHYKSPRDLLLMLPVKFMLGRMVVEQSNMEPVLSLFILMVSNSHLLYCLLLPGVPRSFSVSLHVVLYKSRALFGKNKNH